MIKIAEKIEKIEKYTKKCIILVCFLPSDMTTLLLNGTNVIKW